MVISYAFLAKNSLSRKIILQVSDLASIIQLQIDSNCCRPHIPTRAIRLGETWYGEGAMPSTEYR